MRGDVDTMKETVEKDARVAGLALIGAAVGCFFGCGVTWLMETPLG